MEQNRCTADLLRWDRAPAAQPPPTQRVVGNGQQSARSHDDIEAWIDRMRVQLDPGRPLKKKRELEWVLVAGIAACVLLLLVGSIYGFSSGSSAKKDEPVLLAASGTSMNAADPAAVIIPALASSEEDVPTSEVPATRLRVPRVTEEEPTLPIENDSSLALRPAVKAGARSTAALTDGKPGRIDSRTNRIAGKSSAPARTAKAKSKQSKLARREPAPASTRPKPAKPTETKLALAEQAAPIQSGAVASTPSASAPIIAMPRIKSMRTPYYPLSEMRAGHTGTTTIELLVLESGLVGEATVLSSSGHPKLDAAAIDVAKRSWKFFPGTENGKPMAMKVQAPVRFASVSR